MDVYMFGSERAQLRLSTEHHTPTALESHIYLIHALPHPHHTDAWHSASQQRADDNLAILVMSGLYSSP